MRRKYAQTPDHEDIIGMSHLDLLLRRWWPMVFVLSPLLVGIELILSSQPDGRILSVDVNTGALEVVRYFHTATENVVAGIVWFSVGIAVLAAWIGFSLGRRWHAGRAKSNI